MHFGALVALAWRNMSKKKKKILWRPESNGLLPAFSSKSSAVDLMARPLRHFKFIVAYVVRKALCCAQVLSQDLLLVTPLDGSPPSSSIRGGSQARILERVAMPFSRGSSQSRDRAQISSTAGGFCRLSRQRSRKVLYFYSLSCLDF